MSRKKNESVILQSPGGETTEVVVVEIRGDKVRLGFVYPKEWDCHRREVWDTIRGKPAGESPGGQQPSQP